MNIFECAKTLTDMKFLDFFSVLWQEIVRYFSQPPAIEAESSESSTEVLEVAEDTTIIPEAEPAPIIDTTKDAVPVSVVITPEAEPKEAEPPRIFTIENHRLVGVDLYLTPNMGGSITPEYVIIHYTANASVDETFRHFLRSSSKASAHVIVGRDGQVIQMVPFDRAAWHAGESVWGGRPRLNGFSVGIEAVNFGYLTYRNGKFFSHDGREVPEDQAVRLAHKHDGKMRWWHAYTKVQVDACFEIARALYAHYHMAGVLGHDDVSPRRKQDPGPAFPMIECQDYVARKTHPHGA